MLLLILVLLAGAIIFTLAFLIQDLYQRGHYRTGACSSTWDEERAQVHGRYHVAAWEQRFPWDPPLGEKHEYQHVEYEHGNEQTSSRMKSDGRGELRPLLPIEEEEEGYGTM